MKASLKKFFSGKILPNQRFYMSKASRKIHKETATTVGTGLLINYPLNLSLLYLLIEVLEWSNTFVIGTTITALMTFVAYTRVYTIRRWFSVR
jgi:hypothetical protein